MRIKGMEDFYRKFNIRNRSVIFTWLLSYITVLLVPVMISGIVYISTAGVVKNEINRSNESILMQLEQSVDSTLSGIEQIYLQVAFNKRVISFSNAYQPISNAERIDSYNIMNDIKTFVVANRVIENLYIYYKNSDIVLTQNDILDSKTLFDSLWQNEEISYQQWAKSIGNEGRGRFTSVKRIGSDGELSRKILFIGSGFAGSVTGSDIAVIFEMDGSKLLGNMKNIPLAGDTAVAIIDDEDNILAATRSADLPAAVGFGDLAGSKGVLDQPAAKDSVAVSYIASNVARWKYISMVRSDVFWEKARYIRNLTLTSFVLCLLVGGIATYVFLRRNYNHIHGLVKSIAAKAGIAFDKGENEYRFIQNAMSTTFDEKQKIDLKLKQQSNVVRSSFLSGLLKGRFNNRLSIDEAVSGFDLHFDSGYYAVILFYLEDFSNLFSDKNDMSTEEKFKLLQFIITNVVEELAGQKYYGCMVEVDDMQVCIVNVKGEADGNSKQELEKIAKEAQQFLRDKFFIYLTVSISDIHKDITGIPEAYKEALEAMEYKIVAGNGEIICYQDIKALGEHGGEDTLYYPLLLEQQLINFIKSGDAENAAAVLNNIFEKNFKKPQSIETVDIAKCLMFDLISTMIKTIDEIQGVYGKAFIREIKPVQRLLGCQTVKEMKSEMFILLHQLCAHMEADKKGGQFKLQQSIKAFIESKYANPDLNITMIGEHFGMAPFYLSKLFKEQTGEGILEYIGSLRINKAKEILKECNTSVQEAAHKVGYSDYNTFTRIFKKQEGITPKKYREIN